jgi:hypothetical protein
MRTLLKVFAFSLLQTPKGTGAAGTHLERGAIHKPRFHFTELARGYHAG